MTETAQIMAACQARITTLEAEVSRLQAREAIALGWLRDYLDCLLGWDDVPELAQRRQEIATWLLTAEP